LNNTQRIFGTVVILNLLWAPVNLMIAFAKSNGFSPLGIGCVRWLALSLLLTLLLLSPGFRKFSNYQPMSRLDWARSLAIGLCLFGPSHLLYYASIGLTTEVEGSVLLSTSPLWTAIMAFFILKGEHMTTKRWVAIMLSFVGAYIVAIGFKFPDMMGHTKGNLMFGSGVIIECLLGVIAAKISRRNSGVSVLIGQMWGGAIAFWLAALVFGSSLPLVVPAFSISSYLPLMYLIIISGIITFTIWYRIVEKSPLTLLGVVIAIQPPVAALLNWFVYHTVPSTNSIIGASVIMIALFVGFVGEKATLEPGFDTPGPAS
jgi:drug/metabolite transporter (DMT)-like permease